MSLSEALESKPLDLEVIWKCLILSEIIQI